ncbi:hypothetical protein H109_00834 [Trichophyton interdigitale MR816]|uniref:Serine protease n=1 Tax=Trichophyton interdigitale (strain MR816) TaxID=1215338 RepID=A0A059JHL6_TRIIM|nr:hypothetical protein H101_04030 [Trichophyton interdigitale H6]KDB27381.1 hypothetical protein H109_00834 [Trichophyton interdigitale MR816]
MHFIWPLVTLFLPQDSLVTAVIPLEPQGNGLCGKAFPDLQAQGLTVDEKWSLSPGDATWEFEGTQEKSEYGSTPGFNPNAGNESNITTPFHFDIRSYGTDIGPVSIEGSPFDQFRVTATIGYPWATIGRIFFRRFRGDKGGWCTGTLVGRNLLLTASHCFPWNYGARRWMRFVPGFGHGEKQAEPFGSSYVSQCRGVKNTLNVTGLDYVICKLCEPLGERVGWMGTAWWKDTQAYVKRPWLSSGYPTEPFKGMTQMLVTNLTLDGVDPHGEIGVELESKVFASAGWSGGPMWEYIDGHPTIVGICSGGERSCSEQPGGCFMANLSDPYHDVSAGGKLMTELVRYGQRHWS